eukprot:GHVS01008174.1.p1 GENE.GHVS01008174.1~~GHVS01008174.1.p1  ORF type:complete len:219 (+),score=34.46 GHVS01008174.1:145-801(+)
MVCSKQQGGKGGCDCDCPNCFCGPSMAVVGKKAPDLQCEAAMPDGSFKTVKLSDYAGKHVLLFFYPFDFTFVCPSEIIAFDRAMKDFNDRNVVVLGCSIDSHFVHNAWRNTEPKAGGIGKVQYPLLADVTKKIARDYGVLMEGGMALRGLFIIDKKQTLQHALINNLPIGRSVEEAIRTIDALQFHEAHGDVCPANWKKGQKGMKPTAEGVAAYLAGN